ncbi:NAD-P-binding protein [Mycena filopes]|nr:NAD-P-binding protein [Mycena filopes]
MTWIWTAAVFLLPIALLVLYIRVNDRHLTSTPSNVLPFSPTRCTPESVRKAASELRELATPKSVAAQLPPKTGRRYIVVGGAGFLGGWIVLQLLERGEDPKRIRIIDVRAPARHDLTTGPARDVPFLQADITDAAALKTAFTAPWPPLSTPTPEPELTVFHTVATMRFYERSPLLLPLSARVNVQGTQNVLAAARAAGASVLVFTSSGSVAVRTARLLLWPWETAPAAHLQVISDATAAPTRHADFFSNYAVTKREAEQLVFAADKTPTGTGEGVLRTGCIRPANSIYGPGGDLALGYYLVQKVNPAWIHAIVQSCVYVENASLAHLLYEQRLIELSTGTGTGNPDIGGQAFAVTNPGPPPTYGDLYTMLSTLTDGETTFPVLSPTTLLLVAHLMEWYQRCARAWAWLLPPLGAQLINLQPALFNLVCVHLVLDDARARLAPEKGGLGYKGAFTTFEATYKTVEVHKANEVRIARGRN